MNDMLTEYAMKHPKKLMGKKPTLSCSAPLAGSVCSWEPEEDGDSKTCFEWGTDCGFLFRFTFIQDLLNFEFCPYCGKKLKLEESK